MRKSIKSAGIVALSAVLACGALGALAGCNNGGGGNPLGDENTLTVSIYCNAADATTNQRICDEWAADYSAAHSAELGGKKIKVDLANNTNKGNYYDLLRTAWGNDETADIIYLAPRYVRSYAENGNILDLSGYLTGDEYKKDGKYLTSDVWQNGISYYGYIKGQRQSYKMGRPIEVNAAGEYVTATNESATGNDKGTKVGLYGLPKDYSNFSTGYNRNFFSDTLKRAYTTTSPEQNRNVKGPKGEGSGEFTSGLTYTGEEAGSDVITYAATGKYTNPYTGQQVDAVKGQPANIINVGIPVTYKPYNFFRWKNFEAALAGNDPVAVMSDAIGGYTVTIPGFPNDPLSVTQSTFDAVYSDAPTLADIDVPYNKDIAHVTYTYAEYGALIWATTYYLNTFAWANDQTPTSGRGGAYFANEPKEEEKYKAIYGGEQYEGIAGATGSVLYLLPWLAANDADLINDLSTLTAQNLTDTNVSDATDWKSKAGTQTYSTTKRTLADTDVKKNVQFGHNSQNFIETCAAFLAIGSDWNGNPSGDTESERGEGINGWFYFRSGRSLFYGAGSWDGATRNDVHTDILDFGQMPTPVAEKYALYSEIKDANYQKAVYSNDPAKATAGSAAEANQRATLSAGCKVYSQEEILQNQLRRQDKWAARMDTVGYAVASKVANYPEAHAWKEQAAVSLAARLSINEDAQKTLLYAGAQLPNFVSQCKDFVNYKELGENGAFKDMLTPEGFYDDATIEAGKATWDYYYDIALEMEEAAKNSDTRTVDEFLANKKHSDGTSAIRYDKSYGSRRLADFTGEGTARIAFAMKVLRMVTYRADDRDINIRMQYGLNAVRDSSMYTYEDVWMGVIDARGNTNMLAYLSQKPLASNNMARNFLKLSSGVCSSDYIQMNPTDTSKEWSYMTPAVWCFKQAPTAQRELLNAVQKELNAMAGK